MESLWKLMGERSTRKSLLMRLKQSWSSATLQIFPQSITSFTIKIFSRKKKLSSFKNIRVSSSIIKLKLKISLERVTINAKTSIFLIFLFEEGDLQSPFSAPWTALVKNRMKKRPTQASLSNCYNWN